MLVVLNHADCHTDQLHKYYMGIFFIQLINKLNDNKLTIYISKITKELKFYESGNNFVF